MNASTVFANPVFSQAVQAALAARDSAESPEMAMAFEAVAEALKQSMHAAWLADLVK